MPKLNEGTLLENIVLIETARLALASTPIEIPVDFANSFALPPLEVWTFGEKTDVCLNLDRLNRLFEFRFLLPNSYPDLLRACLCGRLDGGPNGALLVALLAGRERRAIRMWLNDLPRSDRPGSEGQERYPGTISKLAELGAVLHEADSKVDPPTLAICDASYPLSLEHLRQSFDQWARQEKPGARLGYLDPDHYQFGPPDRSRLAQPITSSEDHKEWLGLLSRDNVPLILSVHFTGGRFPSVTKERVIRLREDAQDCGYDWSLGIKRGNHNVVVSGRYNIDREGALRLGSDLAEAIRQAWDNWIAFTGGGSHKIHIDLVDNASMTHLEVVHDS